MRVLSVTGSRSDYSLMSKLFQLLAQDSSIEHHLAVTGMLLNQDHIDIWNQIQKDGFGVLHPIVTFGDSQDAIAMTKALGKAVEGFADLIAEIKPDYLVLQGDRGEMLAAAIAAAHLNTVILHLSGGDRSGSIDDSIRNAITKFAHIHLTTCKESSDRLVGMGESASRIIEVGEPGLDVIADTELLSREELEAEFGLKPGEPFILACQHPVTTEVERSDFQIEETLAALRTLGTKTIFTYPNNDAGSAKIIESLKKSENEPWIKVVKNLGSRRFLSALRYASVLVGNSSSGIWEAPTFQTPVVNIGSRQHRRTRAGNVIDVPFERAQILEAIQKCISDQKFLRSLKTVKNPYGDGRSSERLLKILKDFHAPSNFLAKWLDP